MKQAGFSLLETLVAFAILAIVLTIIMQIFSGGARASRQSYEYAQATTIAESKLAEMKLGLTKKGAGVVMDKYRWKSSLKKAHYDDLSIHKDRDAEFVLYDLKVTIEWESRSKLRHIDLKTVVLRKRQ